MVTSTQDPSSIAYEIIRRSDGLIALSCNAGKISTAPRSMILRPGQIDLLSADSAPIAKLLGVPPEVSIQIYKQKGVHFFEVLQTGILEESYLSISSIQR